MITAKRKLGNLGEKIACDYLQKQKYIILDKNFHCRFGEIDIIAKDKKTLVFVEVKARANQQFGQPQEAVDYFKQRKIIKTAYYYINLYNLPDDFRIDIVAVILNFAIRKAKLRHFKNAVGEY